MLCTYAIYITTGSNKICKYVIFRKHHRKENTRKDTFHCMLYKASMAWHISLIFMNSISIKLRLFLCMPCFLRTIRFCLCI